MREGQQRCDKHNFIWKLVPEHVTECPMCEHEKDQTKLSMKKVDHTGRKAKSIWWNGENGDAALSPERGELVYHSEYYGDHAENWIVYFRNGKEISRHNTKYIASIEWEDE